MVGVADGQCEAAGDLVLVAHPEVESCGEVRDGVAVTGRAHAQVIARFLELHPGTSQFEVAELVPMRADEF
ncbi:hypothetical protein FM21_34365 [Streptomyces mutabilis]|uniref:Uncharacterized protein n=1 Tax=Streptomyces mutabilis TaxID=67332 RepID=A0A086MR64_9ACTN|nr:hypothetical protein FM21_34365 [Streptomyces mutabilis]